MARTYRHARRNLWRLTYLSWRRFQQKYGPNVTRADLHNDDLKRAHYVPSFEHVGDIDLETGDITTPNGEVIGNVNEPNAQPAKPKRGKKSSVIEAVASEDIPSGTPVNIEDGTARPSQSGIWKDCPGTGVDAGGAAATEASLSESLTDGATTGRFKVGDEVSWTSSNRAKIGKIEQIIPAAALPADFGFKLKDATTPRDHESYIVRTGQTAKDVYWPRVSLLKDFPTP